MMKISLKLQITLLILVTEAGTFGGHVVAEGNFKQILKSDSLTAQYLTEKLKIEVPTITQKINEFYRSNWRKRTQSKKY